MSYVIVDVESDGPIPAELSMVCFGAVICDELLNQTYGSGEKSDQFTPAAFNCSFSGY
jgi:hypothetical protein